MEQDVTWRAASLGATSEAEAATEETMTERRLRQLESVIAQITTGVAVLEPIRQGDFPTLRVMMVNDVAACYFGRLGGGDRLEVVESGFRACGLLDLALMVSLTGQEHSQEAVPAPSAAAAGQLLDLTITPLGCGAVTITFDDVTQRVRASEN